MTALPAKPRRWKRRLLVACSVIAALLLVVAFLLPYFLKRYIETHSEEWIHRKVTIDRIVLNPFTFRYAVTGVTCYEPKSEVVFVSWKNISVHCNYLWSYYNRNWRFTGLRIDAPYFHITQDGDRFNFSDLMELGDSDEAAPVDTSAPVRFSMEEVLISDGHIDYASDVLEAPVVIENLKATCTLISSQSARMDFGLGFDLKEGGRMDGGFMLDTDRSLYGVDAHLRAFQLAQLLPYLQDFFACKALTGTMDGDLALLDSYADTTSLAVSARLGLLDAKLTDPNNENLFSLKNGAARLDTLVAKDQRIEVGDVVLDGGDLRFVMLADGSDNWTRLLKLDTLAGSGDTASTQLQASESNVFVMLADYLSYLGEQVVASEYTAKKIALLNSAVDFEDNTPAQPFHYRISAINMRANRVTSEQEAGRIDATAVLQETGKLKAEAVFDPKNIRNMNVDMQVDGLALAQLDPYGRWYAAHPLEDGVLQYITRTEVRDGKIDSQNKLHVDKLKVGKKVEEHDPEIYVLPLRLAAGLLKDAKGVVELDVPVKGDLNDPEFKAWPIIWKIFKDLLMKAVTAPGKLLTRTFEGVDEEDLERVRFTYLQGAPDKTQRKTLSQVASAMKSKPELQLDLIPIVDTKQEMQEVAIFETKKAFLFADKAAIDGADSTRIAELGSRDSAFTAYVEGRTATLAGKSMHERCLSIIGTGPAQSIAADLEAARREHVMQILLAEGVPAARLGFREGTSEELAGQRGVPGYRFVYDVGE